MSVEVQGGKIRQHLPHETSERCRDGDMGFRKVRRWDSFHVKPCRARMRPSYTPVLDTHTKIPRRRKVWQ